MGVEYVLENPLQTLTTNIRGTEIVLELANKKKQRVILASTSEVAGKKNGKAMFSEDDDRLLGPTTVTRWTQGLRSRRWMMATRIGLSSS